jgi:hypothetical protein
MILNDEQARILKKKIVTYFRAQSQNFVGETEENHESVSQGEPTNIQTSYIPNTN